MINTRDLSPAEIAQMVQRDQDFVRSMEKLEIRVMLDTLWALYGPKDPGAQRPRRSRRLTVSRPERAIRRHQDAEAKATR